ncbi:MAG: polysaccharide biosynthesis C-terminal domain-containing protein [Flavobacteriales bacterium]|nr:polysaccharide biosynthesis C-terminal domain-containing protein [Flavobacteriales bacterium]
MKTRKKAIRRSKYVGLETISFLLRPIHTSLVSLLIIRLFDVDLWGSFVVLLVGVELLTSLFNWGQKPFLLREFSLSPNTIGEQWSRASYARLPFLILIVILLMLIPVFQVHFFPLLLWVFFKWFSFLFEPIIQFYRKYTWSIISEMAAITTAISCVLFFSEEMVLTDLIYLFVLSSGVKCLVLLPLLNEWERTSFSLKMLRTELLLAFPFFGLSIAGLLQTKGDLYVVTYLLQEEDLASYQIILSFLLLGQSFSAILLGPFQKNIYRWQGKNIQKLKKLYLQVGFVATIVFSIILYYGLKYVYLIELPLVYIALFFAYLYPLYAYFIESQILLKHKNEKQLLRYNVIAAVCNIVISLLLVSMYGIVGALLGGIVCRLILAKLVVSRSKKIINDNDS